MCSSIVVVLKINTQRKSPCIFETYIELLKKEMVLCLVLALRNPLCFGGKEKEVKTNLVTHWKLLKLVPVTVLCIFIHFFQIQIIINEIRIISNLNIASNGEYKVK